MHPDFVEFGMLDYLYTYIVYKRWTPSKSKMIRTFIISNSLPTDTIVADLFIVAVDGTHLRTLTEIKVERQELLLQLVY